LQNHKEVIAFQSSEWRFFDYEDEIEDWYRELSEEGQDIFNALLKTNSKVSLPIHWNGCKMLQGECKKEGIWEWRFLADGRQQRLLGVFGESRKIAIFLIGCSHKQNIYKPSECLSTAIMRAKKVKQGAKLNEREIRSNL